MIYLVASDRKPALRGKGGIDGEGAGAPPVTARRWEPLLHLPTASPSAGSDSLSLGIRRGHPGPGAPPQLWLWRRVL